MHPTNRSAAWPKVIVVAVAALVIGCGSPATSGPDDGPETSEPGAASTAPVSNPTDAPPTPGGGGSGGDVEAVGRALAPPSSTETLKTTADDTWFVMYETTESIDALKRFYEGAIPGAGMRIYSTTEANGGIAWAFATDDDGSFGGAINIFPSGNGSNFAVQVTVGKS